MIHSFRKLLLPQLVLCSVLLSLNAWASPAASLLKEAGINGGLAVHINCGDGSFTADLAINNNLLIQGLAKTPQQVMAAQKHIEAKKLCAQVSINQYDGVNLPYIDNVVNIVIAEKTSISMEEIMRVLRPLGVAIINGKKSVKPWPEGIDEWTHYLHTANNNAVAHDSTVGPPRHMQWQSHPKWTRHHDKLASISTVVTAQGRLFYILDEGAVHSPNNPAKWSLVARDAFNGTFLWKKDISNWANHLKGFRSGPVQLQRLLVSVADKVYVTLGIGKAVSVLHASNGEEIISFKDTLNAEEIMVSGPTLVTQVGTGSPEHALSTKGDQYKKNKKLVAVDINSGKTLWQYPAERQCELMPRTLTINDGKVYIQEKQSALCLDLQSGKKSWQSDVLFPLPAPKIEKPTATKGKKEKKKKKKKKKPAGMRRPGWTFSTFVASEGVLLCADGKKLIALDVKGGTELWQCQSSSVFNKTPEVDIFVINGVAWHSPTFSQGRELRTGKILSENNLQEKLITAGHHARCYRNKATNKYIIQGYRGLEFRDTEGDNHYRHNWIRGLCQYGIMPANGLVYIPPHNCGCYSEAKLFGFWTLSASQSKIDINNLACNKYVEKGPAYGKAQKEGVDSTKDWPIYRHNSSRSGITPNKLNTKLSKHWEAKLPTALSPPVIAGDTLIVAAMDKHKVIAINNENGKKKWSYSAGSRIDSAPTIYGNTVIFGCRDGYVYSLLLDSGELVWRFRAAPLDLKTVSMDHVESVWPVHGSVLISHDTLYFVAGRSTYIDGGMFAYGLNPISGEVKVCKRMQSEQVGIGEEKKNIESSKISQNMTDYKTFQQADKSDAFSMDGGNLSDILVESDGALYLRHQKLTTGLKRDSKWTHHLFSTSRLVDDNESHRSHWSYGKGDFSRLPVAYEWLTRNKYGGFSSPMAKYLIYDKNTAWTHTGHGSQHILKYDISEMNAKLLKDFPASKEYAPDEFGDELDFHVRAFIKADNNFVVAGFPKSKDDLVLYNQPSHKKGTLSILSAKDGKTVLNLELPAPPRFDGMAVANGKLYISCEDGRVLCYK
ncbi:MAG: PQQ-binding-like beta-propeller repeat protein [Planctomycetes bacterium]|nr:PQQ-binding-like beta-propeller repeat protein [Planctomycetota bacterium]